MAPLPVFGPIRKEMKATSWQINVKDMDHGFKCETALQEEKLCSALGVIAGIWLQGDMSDPEHPVPWSPEDGTEMEMYFDENQGKAIWTGWNKVKA